MNVIINNSNDSLFLTFIKIIIPLIPSIIAIIISIKAYKKSIIQNKVVSSTDIVKTILDAKSIFDKNLPVYLDRIDKCSTKKSETGLKDIIDDICVDFENYLNRVELGCYNYIEGIIDKKIFKGLIYDILKKIITDINYQTYYEKDSYEYIFKVWEEWSKLEL